MKIHIRASGSLKSRPLKELCAYYETRILFPLEIAEISPSSLHKNTHNFLETRSHDSCTYLLDEKGKNLASHEWAQLIKKAQLEGLKYIYFLIGDADGFDSRVLDACPHRLSFGAQTWPHDLVRLLLLEQLYRSQQILANHPYHKQG